MIGGLPFGGVETLFLSITKALHLLGHKPIVINLSGTGQLNETFRREGIPLFHVGNSTKDLKTTKFFTTYRLRRLLKILNPDIVHTSHFSADYHTRIAAIGLSIPIVTHYHNLRKEKKIFRRLANGLLSFVTDIHIAVSQAVGTYGVQPYNWAKRPCKILYNAINSQELNVATATSLDSLFSKFDFILFSISRLVPEKNIDMLIQITSCLKQDIPGLSLLIIGEGVERKRLEALAIEEGVEDRVFFTGFRPDVPGILKTLSAWQSLCVMPSQSEGFGLAILEGFHFGIPAIISPYVPLVEIAGDAVKVVELDKDQFVKNIKKLLLNNQQMKHMQLVARNIASKYTMDTYIQRLLQIYRGLIL